MYNNVAEIIHRDEYVSEFGVVRVGKHIFNCFIDGGPNLQLNTKYKAKFTFEYLTDDSGWRILTEYDDDPGNVESIKSKDDLFNTEAIGHVKNGIFYVGDLEIDFMTEYVEHDKCTENQYIEVIANRVHGEFYKV